jgi:hypothetical protein
LQDFKRKSEASAKLLQGATDQLEKKTAQCEALAGQLQGVTEQLAKKTTQYEGLSGALADVREHVLSLRDAYSQTVEGAANADDSDPD